MSESGEVTDREVLRFIYEWIDSVPHLEALLLIWSTRPKPWSVDDLARRLYVEPHVGAALLHDLVQNNLIDKDSGSPEHYLYVSKSPETENLIAAVHTKYRAEIIAISTMIHRKASSAVRDFAEAFRFIKGRD